MNPERKKVSGISARQIFKFLQVAIASGFLAITPTKTKAESPEPKSINDLLRRAEKEAVSNPTDYKNFNAVLEVPQPLEEPGPKAVMDDVEDLKAGFDGLNVIPRGKDVPRKALYDLCKNSEDFCNTIVYPGNFENKLTDQNMYELMHAFKKELENFEYVSDEIQYGVSEYWIVPENREGDCEDFAWRMFKVVLNDLEKSKFRPENLKFLIVDKLVRDGKGNIVLNEQGFSKYDGHAVLALQLRDEEGKMQTIIFDVNQERLVTAGEFFENGNSIEHILRQTYEFKRENRTYKIKVFKAILSYDQSLVH